MKAARLLFLLSWVGLSVVLAGTALLSANSLWVAYTSPQDYITGQYTLAQVQEQGGENAVKAVRGRRATAATWALGYALLGLMVVILPYRRKEKWAWWAILISMVVPQLLSLARVPMLSMIQGSGTALVLLALTVLALLAGAPAFFRREAVATVE